MKSVTIREATEEDFGRLEVLFDDVAAERNWINTEPGFDKERKRRRWRDVARGTDEVQFVACDGADIVGCLGINGDRDIGLLVRKDRRGQGIGTALLHAAFKWAEERHIQALTLGVFPHNAPAIALYRKSGFVETGRIERFIPRQTGEVWDVIRMCKRFDRSSS